MLLFVIHCGAVGAVCNLKVRDVALQIRSSFSIFYSERYRDWLR